MSTYLDAVPRLARVGQVHRWRYNKPLLVELATKQIRQAAGRERQEAFEAALPHGHVDDTRFIHTDPKHRALLAKAALKARRIGWREAEWFATLTAQDLENETQFGWVCMMVLEPGKGFLAQSCWDPDRAHRVPEGIPIGTPSAADRLEWQPYVTAWDIEDAAYHELELGVGGMATLELHKMLNADHPRRMAATAAIARVDSYLNYHYARRDGYPEDPWDPNEWGHDARLSSLVLTDLSANSAITLTPAFDPDVYEYTTSQSIAPPLGVTTTNKDPLLTGTPPHAFSDNNTTLTITNTAKDGSTTAKYVVKVAT